MPLTRRAVLLSTGALAAPSIIRSASAADPIRFGWLVALTGANSAPGIGYNRGVLWAADQINASGGIKGRKVEIVTRDTQGDPTKAVNAAVELASRDKVHAVFGPTNSGEALATTPILSRFKVPNLQQGVLDRLIDPEKYPYAFRNAATNTQWDTANRNYCVNVLKAKSVAVLGDNTGYGTTAVAASVEAYEKAGVKVAYHAVIDANAQDLAPDLLRARNAGAEVVTVWSDSTGLDARMMNARARINWDVVFAGHPAMGSGDVAHLLDKPSNWDKVYIVGYRPCTLRCQRQAAGAHPGFRGQRERQDHARRYVAMVGRCGHRCGAPGDRGGGEDRIDQRGRHCRLLEQSSKLARLVRPLYFLPDRT